MRVAQIQKGGQEREGNEEGTVSTKGEGREEIQGSSGLSKNNCCGFGERYNAVGDRAIDYWNRSYLKR